jgi:DNA-binding NtrC family response regulator
MPVALVLGQVADEAAARTVERLQAGGLTVRTARTHDELVRELARGPLDLLVLAADAPDQACRTTIAELASSRPGMLTLAAWSAAGGAAPRSAERRDAPAPGEEIFVSDSAAMAAALARLERVAGLDATVLVNGESGTGKELAARFLHERHPRRRRGPLVCLHCGAIPDTLLESELFGHVRGAFTGAERDRAGRFEQAHGGTLLLDEISTMKPEAQVKLLRVLQERRVTRLGGSESRPVDVRVVVATNQALQPLVDAGSFRLDLYHRIRTFPVTLPPLRERPADIPALVERFCRLAVARMGLGVAKRFAPATLQLLAGHAWPGNVRELENVVDYAAIVSEDREEILPTDLPPELAGIAPQASIAGPLVTEDGLSLRTAVSNLERELILQSLRLAEGNKARAAALLDLKRTTFLEKLGRLQAEGLLAADQADWSSACPAGIDS